MKKKLFLIIDMLLHFIPMNNKYIFIKSYDGLYNDNPKFISEKLYSIDKNIKLIWSINANNSNSSFPSYIYTVPTNSLKEVIMKNRSRVIIDNYLGYHSLYISKNTSKPLLYLFKHIKKKGQFNLSTWHGTPIKKIAIDVPSNNIYYDFITTSDLYLCGCEYTETILKHISFGKIPSIRIGTPRNDQLINMNNMDLITLKQDLKLPLNNKILLIAPTFRDDKYYIMNTYLHLFDFDKLRNKLQHRFGGNWSIVIRLHDKLLGVGHKINFEGCYDGNLSDDMADYLAVSDILITDYSSSIFDYTLTKKPCFLFCPDFSYYKDKERGFYFDLEQFPFPFSETFDGLINNIQNYISEDYIDKVNMLLSKLGNYESGIASFEISKYIYHHYIK